MLLFMLGLAWSPPSAALVVVEHEQPDRRGQVALLAIAVDFSYQLGERVTPLPGDILHAAPECIFDADAGLVAANDDRAFDDR